MSIASGSYGHVKFMSKALILGLLPAMPVTAETVVVAALGDSLTQGYGLVENEGFVPQLSNWLTNKGADVQVVNAGVSGDTTQGGLARTAWTLTSDVDALIITLGGNDLLRGIDPAVSRSNLAGIIEIAQAKDVEVLLIGMTAPLNFGADYKKSFDGMYETLSLEYDINLGPDFFAGLRDIALSDRGSVMQSDQLHPNAVGVGLIVEVLGPYVLTLVEQVK